VSVDLHQVWYGEPYSLQSLALLVAVVLPWLLLETWRSRRHERALRAAGALEPADDVYAWMRVVYPGMFLAMTAEGVLAPPACTTLVAIGIGVFLAAKLLKWWAIVSLGRFWSFNVLVLPGVPLATGGPYRFMRHPNYVAVMGEIAGVALMMRAPFTGMASAIVFGALLVARIRVEERMLKEAR
jgi:methyltransferase